MSALNGFGKLLMEAERELARCHTQMKDAQKRGSAVEYAHYTRMAMEAEAVKAFIQYRTEGR